MDIGKTIHPHPTLGESIGMAAEVAHGRFWIDRVGDCRVICDIHDGALRVLEVPAGIRHKVVGQWVFRNGGHQRIQPTLTQCVRVLGQANSLGVAFAYQSRFGTKMPPCESLPYPPSRRSGENPGVETQKSL